MGLPPRRPKRRAVLDPRTYLRWVMGTGLLVLLVMPIGADATLALTKTVRSEDRTCRIVRILDGDTVTTMCGLQFRRTRLAGFDTPELFSPQCAAESWAAWQAKLALRLALWRANDIVFVTEGTDRYDRHLARVLLDGENLAGHMVSNGHARPYAGGKRSGWCS